MDGRDWSQFLLPYEQAVEELKLKLKGLRNEFKRRHAYSPIEFVTGRVKKISSILEKAKRYRVPMDRLDTGIEDIAGIRVMCQFEKDIETVVELIRERQDLKIRLEKDYIKNRKTSGYRSYHMIVEYSVYTSVGHKLVLVEIQIRTLAMNFWATIEHSLNYKYREQLPEDVKTRLQKAAEAAYVLDQEMSAIREEIVESQKWFEDRTSIVYRVLNDIQDLYYQRKIREAVQFQLRFNELFEEEDLEKWRALSYDLQQLLSGMKQKKIDQEGGGSNHGS